MRTSIRRAAVAAGLIATLAGVAPVAVDARISSRDRLASSVALQCGYYQDLWDALAKKLGEASRSGTQAEYDRIKGQMMETLRQWNYLCSSGYGSIMYRTVPLGTLATTSNVTLSKAG